MPTLSTHQIAMLAVMAAVVIAIRALPFLLCRGKAFGKILSILDKIGQPLTAAAIAMLCVYSFASLCDFNDPNYLRLLLAIPATALTILLQLFIRNPMLSICGGTACYMLLLHCA